MERKGSFTALLITALLVLVSALQREYFLVTEPASWNDAQQYCRSHHTDLAFIHTKEEANNVSALGNGNLVWIGIHRDTQNHTLWYWSGRRTSTFTDWESGQPNDREGNEDCGSAKTGGGWYDLPCDKKINFVCYQETPKVVLVKENKTWEEALEYCRDQDSDLPSLLSEAEQSSAKKTTSEAQTSQVWTGLRFLAGQWLWVNGDGLEFQDWPAGEMPFCPARYLHCGTLDKEEEHWGTRDCKEKLNFLCVKKWSD
ncbi:putative C-type lectin domain family 20 member A [Hypomesus transpacificus]|uniref:putative C-type lectin domain family 20 member A n=1 Tax=Hypomesus transpacificus TaxID=137520 RepID=UPI001F0837E2|nr:putative C-type lectin domain family 20 member A [Hypomesus transpacificus]